MFMGLQSPVSGDGAAVSAVDLVLRANPASGASSRWRVSRGPAGFSRCIDFATPLASGLWRVQRMAVEDTELFVRLYDMYLATRALVESTYLTGDTTSEPGILNVAAPSGGGWQNTAGQNPYTATVGDTLTFNFTGTGLDLRTYTDNRGGVWNVEVDGVQRASFSTWASVGAYATFSSLVRGLPQGAHTCILRFAGADPLNAPAGAVPARGWIARSIMATPTGADLTTYGMVRVVDLRDTFTVVHQLLAPGSNVEIAIQSRLNGQVYAYEYWPKHATNAVNTQLSTGIYIDGTAVSTTALSATWADATKLEVFEQSRGANSAASGTPLVECAMTAVCDASGYTFRADITALEALDVNAAYTCMCPAYNADRARYVNGDVLDVSAHNGTMVQAARQITSGWLDDPVRHSYCMAWEISDPWRSLRRGKTGSEPNWNRVQTRSDGTRFSKAYPYMVAAGAVIPKGEVFVVAGRLVGGVVPAV